MTILAGVASGGQDTGCVRMKFNETRIPGVWVVETEPAEDERGWFSRSWCKKEFAAHGLNTEMMQCGMSLNRRKGTLRGMHYQSEPHGECKLVRCLRGALHDVVVDLRPHSPVFRQVVAVDLTQDNLKAIYIPEGVAHGFQTLVDDTLVYYQMSEYYESSAACGVRWDDPAFGIEWPLADLILSDKDQNWPDFTG